MNQQEDLSKIAPLSYIIKLLKDVILFLLRRWIVLLIVGLLFGALGYFVAKYKGYTYVAYASFTNQEANSASFATQIASQIGINIGSLGGSNNDAVNVIGLSTSRRIVVVALLQKATINQKNDLLINHYISLYKQEAICEKISEQPNFRFTHSNIKELSSIENELLNYFFEKINENIIEAKYDDEIGFNVLKVTSKSLEFSQALNQNILAQTNQYLFELAQKKTIEQFDVTVDRKDSIYKVLQAKELQLARLKDSKKNNISSSTLVDQSELIRDIAILSQMYSQASAAFEISKVTLSTNQSGLLIIDSPSFSVKIERPSKLLYAVVFAFLSEFITVCLMLFYKSFNQILKKEQNEIERNRNS